MLTKLFAVPIVAALLLAAVAAGQTTSPSKTWALVIGVSKYQKLPGGQQLQFAERDALLFAQSIQKRGVPAQNVRVLTGTEATTAAIKSAIGNWLARSASESDTILLYFSGHGLFEREFGESYLLGTDSDPKDPYGTALSLGEIGQALGRRVRAGRVMIIADAVKRDFFDPDADPESAKSFALAFEQMTASRPGVSTILASGPGEFSREGQRWGGQGVFTRHLADVLIDGGDPGGNLALAADDLFELLRSRVSEDTANKQHPWRSGASLARASRGGIQPQANAPPMNVTANPKPAEPVKPAEVTASKSANAGQQASKLAELVPERQSRVQPKSTEESRSNDKNTSRESIAADAKALPPARPAVEKKPKPAAISNERKVTSPTGEKKLEAAAGTTEKKSESAPTVAIANTPSAAAPKPAANSGEVAPATVAPPKTSPRAAAPPATQPVHAESSTGPSPPELARKDASLADIPTPPKPTVNPPSSIIVPSASASGETNTLSTSIPTSRPEAAPSPLVLQLEAAIASRSLIEPKNASAWELYTRLSAEPGAVAETARLKPVLAEALAAEGRTIVTGDLRSDNIADKVDDFKRAGQMLARARSLAPEKNDVAVLEKLSAAAALLALQFYDEAERALAQLQGAKLASVENALGLVCQGKLDSWRAERAFKRAIELDPKWAAPHYNLAVLYRSQQNQESLAELESAAALEPASVTLLTALGEEYFTRQQWKQAADTFRKAIALKPADDALHTKLGHALYSQGLQDEANREYQRAKELRSKQP